MLYHHEIIKLAEEGNKAELEALLEKGAFIDEQIVFVTPAESLAREGNKDAIRLLISLGADDRYIIQGLAYSDNIDIAYELKLNMMPYFERYAIQGYVLGNHKKRLRTLIQQNYAISDIASAYAHAGKVNQVNKLIKLGADITQIACAYASVQNFINMNELIKLGADKTPIAFVCAYQEYNDQVQQLLNNGADITYVAYAYAVAGLSDEVNKLLNDGADLTRIACAYASVNNTTQADNLIEQGADITTVACVYIEKNNIEAAEALRLEGADIYSLLNTAHIYQHSNYITKLENIISGESLAVEKSSHNDQTEKLNQIIEKQNAQIEELKIANTALQSALNNKDKPTAIDKRIASQSKANTDILKTSIANPSPIARHRLNLIAKEAPVAKPDLKRLNGNDEMERKRLKI